MVKSRSFTVTPREKVEIINITQEVKDTIASLGIQEGVATIFLKHTSAALTIQEDERLLKQDFINYLNDMIRDDPNNPKFLHNCSWLRPECPSDEPMNFDAHMKAMFIGNSVSCPVKNGKLDLGQWQSVLLVEMDGKNRQREVVVMIDGEPKKSEIEQYLDEVRPLIIERMKSTFPFSDDEYPDIAQDIRKGLEGGKHLRGGLCVLVSDALGGDRDKVLSYGACIDGTHFSTLVHDDLIDQDQERRDKVAFWVKHGPRKAVIVGDRLFALLKKRFLELGHKEASIYVETLDTITSGVAQEINLAEFGIDLIMGRVHKNLYPKVVKAKTASLFKAAARLGAMAAGAKEEQEEKLARYGELLGFGFQVADDLCDLALLRGVERPQVDKLGSVVLMGIHYDSISFKSLLKPLLRGEGVVELIKRSKLEERAMRDIKAKINEANSCLKGIRLKKPYGDYLRDYAEYCVEAILAEANLSLS